MIGGFSNPLSHGSSLSRERLLVDADRLFSIDWLINKLLNELHGSMTQQALAQSHKYFFQLRQQPELWFAWHMIKNHHASLAKIDEFRQLFPESGKLIAALNEEREEAIKAFMKFVASKRWDYLRDDERSWREYACILYKMKDKNAEIEQKFFELLDYICTMTDALCGRWNLLFPTSDANEDTNDDASHVTNPDLDSVQPRAEFKALLKGEWFDKNCADKEKYNNKWRDKFVDELLKSEHAQVIINHWDDRSLVDMLGIIGAMKDAGVFTEGLASLALAKSILNYHPLQKKDKTLSKYIGDAQKLKCYDWVKEYVEKFD